MRGPICASCVHSGSHTPCIDCQPGARRFFVLKPEVSFGPPAEPAPAPDALQVQVGGDHYKRMKIQPYEFAVANGLNACEFNIVKYTVRRKGDQAKRLEDLQKAKHTIDVLMDLIKSGKSE